MLGRVFLIVAALAAPALAAPSHVRAKLIADTSAIVPGKPFLVGVQFDIDPGWHIYWSTAGDAGLPTRVKFDLPPELSVGPLQYPTPRRLELAGGIVNFGYEHSVLLFAQVTPSADLPANEPVTIKAQVSWLVCSDICVIGKTDLEQSLPVAKSADPANAELFAAAKAAVPVDAATSPAVAGVTTSGEMSPSGDAYSGDFNLHIVWHEAAPPIGSIQFLPEAPDAYKVLEPQIHGSGKSTQIAFAVQSLAGQEPTTTTMDIVIGYDASNGAHRGVIVHLKLPRAGG